MKKKMSKILIIIGILLLAGSVIFGIVQLIKYLRIKYAKIEVVLTDTLTIEFTEEKHVSDFITSINGKIIDNYIIDSTKLGKKEVSFDFINDDNIKVSYSYTVEIVDTVEPMIWLGNSYTISKGSNINLVSRILCGDNEDSNPNCYIEGEYDSNQIGSYPLIFKAEDRSGNISEQPFTLNIVNPSKSSSTTKTYTYFSDVVKNYKTEDTRIGIDVSHWQGDIDFSKLKDAGVEFVIIRVGGTRGTDGEYFVDDKFIQNITEANKHNIDIGIYFYSYANSNEHAMKDALWVIDHIKDYKISLPIAFDWEEWGNFNEYHLSFFGLNDMAYTFLDTIENAGYQGMLYSSKNYLERIWIPSKYDVWLAHYTNKTNYQGTYKFWQMCSDGRVDGINGAVDIDIMYLNV